MSAAASTTELPTPKRIEAPKAWKVKDVAEYTGMSTAWVYAQAAAGKIPSKKLGGAVRFDPELVKRWFDGENVEVGRQKLASFLRERKDAPK